MRTEHNRNEKSHRTGFHKILPELLLLIYTYLKPSTNKQHLTNSLISTKLHAIYNNDALWIHYCLLDHIEITPHLTAKEIYLWRYRIGKRLDVYGIGPVLGDHFLGDYLCLSIDEEDSLYISDVKCHTVFRVFGERYSRSERYAGCGMDSGGSNGELLDVALPFPGEIRFKDNGEAVIFCENGSDLRMIKDGVVRFVSFDDRINGYCLGKGKYDGCIIYSSNENLDLRMVKDGEIFDLSDDIYFLDAYHMRFRDNMIYGVTSRNSIFSCDLEERSFNVFPKKKFKAMCLAPDSSMVAYDFTDKHLYRIDLFDGSTIQLMKLDFDPVDILINKAGSIILSQKNHIQVIPYL